MTHVFARLGDMWQHEGNLIFRFDGRPLAIKPCDGVWQLVVYGQRGGDEILVDSLPTLEAAKVAYLTHPATTKDVYQYVCRRG